MSQRTYAKIIIDAGGPSFETYRQRLEQLADPGVDVGLVQVGVHEALLRPHLVHHLVARQNQPADQLLKQQGASAVRMITPEDAFVLAGQRVEQDLQPKPPATFPDDWYIDAIRLPTAWAAVGGPDQIAWGDIKVGHIDTGYTWHAAFGHTGPGAGGSWLRAADCRTIMYQDVPAEYGMPTPMGGDGRDPMPLGAVSKGHGTRIGSVISGWADLGGGKRFRGAAPKVPHVVVRITDSVAINTRQNEFIEALDYLVNTVKVDVVNVSLGVFPPVASPQMKAALKAATAKGVIVVCAAGNIVDPVVVPAALPEAIAVGGVSPYRDEHGQLQMRPWSGSSFGPEVDFSAPADQIFRADPQRSGLGQGFLGNGDGTSYATALTTGSAALWLLRWAPQINAMYGRTAKRVQAFRAAVQATCSKPPNWEPTPFGTGVLDTGRLCTDMQAALPLVAGSFPMPPVPVAPPVVAPVVA
jgi:hypothetical protein